MPLGPGQTGQSRYPRARLQCTVLAAQAECRLSRQRANKPPEYPSSRPPETKADRKWESRLNPMTARNGHTHRGSTGDHPIPARDPDGPYLDKVATVQLNNLRKLRIPCCRSVPPVGQADDDSLPTGRRRWCPRTRGPKRCWVDLAQIGPTCAAPTGSPPHNTENQIRKRRRPPLQSAPDPSHRSRPAATAEWSQPADLAAPAKHRHEFGQELDRCWTRLLEFV